MFKHLLFILILVGGSYYYWTTRPVNHGPGVVAPKEPVQKKLLRTKSFDHKSSTITPIAEFETESRVLSKERYHDEQAEIVPYDFVLGWGPMSDERNLDFILVKQSSRSFYWEMTKPPIPQNAMSNHSTNIHLIPSNEVIHEKLKEVRRGHVVRMKGKLVNVISQDGWEYKSSLSRSDIGKNSAEVLWIEEFRIIKP